MNTKAAIPVQRARVTYVAHLRRAERRGDYLRSIVPEAGVTGNGNVLYRGRVIGAFTILGDGIFDRHGHSAPIGDRDAIADFFRRAAVA